MDIELEQKYKKVQLLEDKIGIADVKVLEEMNKLDLNKTSNEEKIIELCLG